MVDNSGLLINIDENSAKILDGRIYDRIVNPCTILEIRFTCEDLLVFEDIHGGYYFRYCGMDWVPFENKFNMTSDGCYLYNIKAFPKTMFKMITKPAENTGALARAMGLGLSTYSKSLDLKCPLINLSAYSLIKRHRLLSLKDAYLKRDLGLATFIYCNSQYMFSTTWYTMNRKTAKSLSFTELEQENVFFTVNDSRIKSHLSMPQVPKKWNEEDYLAMMTGVSFDFDMPKGANFCDVYTLKFDNNSSLDSNVPMLCTKVELNLTDSSKFKCTFTRVELHKEKK